MDARFCSECGTRLHGDAEYCPVCGTRYHEPTPPPLKEEEPPVMPEEDLEPDNPWHPEPETHKETLPERVRHPEPAPEPEPLWSEEPDIDPEPEIPERPGRNGGMDSRLKLLIVMIGVVAVLLTLFIWFFFLKESESDITWDADPQEMIDEDAYNDARLNPTLRIDESETRQETPDEQVEEDENGEETLEEETQAEEEAQPAVNREEKHFTGTIDGNPVSLTLNATTGNGYYTITKDGESHRMNLSCSISPDGYITINEFTPDGEYAGEWEGVYRDGVFSGQGTFQGTTTSFSLTESN